MGIAIFEQKILPSDRDYDISMYRALPQQIITKSKLLLKFLMGGCFAVLLLFFCSRSKIRAVNLLLKQRVLNLNSLLFLRKGRHYKTANVGWYDYNTQNS